MPYSMMLDSGHGGSDPGAVYRGRREKDDTLRLTLAVGEILQENGKIPRNLRELMEQIREV